MGTSLRSVALLVVVFGVGPCRGQGNTPRVTTVGRPIEVNIAYSSKALVQVPSQEVEAAVSTWMEAIVRRVETGMTFSCRVLDMDGRGEVARLLRRGELDILGMNAIDYLVLRHLGNLEPVVSAVMSGAPCVPYVLLVRRTPKRRTIADLRGKRLVVDLALAGTVPTIWLDTVLLRNGLAVHGAFFGRTNVVRKSLNAVLPVFFGQADACVVSKPAFETMVELNPQVGEKIVIIEESVPLLGGLSCFRRDLDAKLKEDLRYWYFNYHTDPVGRQMSLLFRVDRLVAYEPSHLETVEALYEEYLRLRRAHEGKARGSR